MRRSVFGTLLVILLVIALASFSLSLLGRYIIPKFSEKNREKEVIEKTTQTDDDDGYIVRWDDFGFDGPVEGVAE